MLQGDKRVDDLLVVKNLRPQPAAIGQAGEKKRYEHVALGLKTPVLCSLKCQHHTKYCDDDQQGFQHGNIEDIGTCQITKTIHNGKYRENGTDHDPEGRPYPSGGTTVHTREVGRETNQKKNEQAENRPAEYDDALPRLAEVFVCVRGLAEYGSFFLLKDRQYSSGFELVTLGAFRFVANRFQFFKGYFGSGFIGTWEKADPTPGEPLESL